ncbi:helix-turn-helix domain-containing protein [Anatilimnocola floriformis]|uniref:helix-turn-helix domain-containing protein n=1 Tax=Anatilimnocola floriformis TaxID=2948575 RepID=UPI0020C4C1CD|nr:helix-turn-helix domain-containing protein [Anatilimnocola floriformis]
MSDEFVTPEEFATVTNQGIATVYRRLRAGQLPAHQSGGRCKRWLIDLVAFRARFTGESSSSTNDGAALPPSGGSVNSGTASQSAATSSSPPRPALNGPRPRWTTQIRK